MPPIQLDVQQVTGQGLLSRRGVLRISIGGAALGLTGLAAKKAPANVADGETSVIQIWLAGGPSHLDLYDLKPDAPAEFRGPYRPVSTVVPGIQICEQLPLQARVFDRLTLIRSLTHPTSDHVAGTHLMQTGHFGPTAARPAPTHPSAGSVVSHFRSDASGATLPYVHVRTDLAIDLYRRQFGAAHFGSRHEPFDVKLPFPFWSRDEKVRMPGLETIAELDVSRLEDRVALSRQLDLATDAADVATRGNAASDFHPSALELLSDERARQAFDVSRESDATRERYGKNGWGQAALIARRLVETGSTFVTVNTDTSSNMWDNHGNLVQAFDRNLPAYDRFLTALLEDLHERGLYDRVIVFVCGEFGRTPRFNERAGRDHWGRAGFALIGGGGLRTGQVIGSTTPHGEEPASRPISPADLLATLYFKLGIDARAVFVDPLGRPHQVLDSGRPIRELL